MAESAFVQNSFLESSHVLIAQFEVVKSKGGVDHGIYL